MSSSDNRPTSLDWDAPISSPEATPSAGLRPVRHRPRPGSISSPDQPVDPQLNESVPAESVPAPGIPAGGPSPPSDRQPASPNYLVGYKRPPGSGQFKKGQSGNPKGRPRGAKSMHDLFDQELSATVPIREGGRSRKISKREVIVKRQINKAMEGDPKSTELIMKVEGVIHRGGRGPAGSGDAGPVDPRQEEIEREIAAEFLAMAGEAPRGGKQLNTDGDDDDDRDP
jgi:hypothetical protein